MPPPTSAAVTYEVVARTAVFETVELLEQILLHLPMKDLLMNSRVCRQWHNTVIGSLQIQRALFMKPEPTGCVMRFRFPDRLNKIPEDDPTRFWIPQEGGHDFHLAYLNPLLAKKVPFLTPFATLLDRAASFAIEQVTALPIKNCMNIKSSASWQRMYLTQPPEIAISFERRHTRFRLWKTPVYSQGGLKMGKIVNSTRYFSSIWRTKMLDVTGGLKIDLTYMRLVTSAEEMAMLHESARGNSNKPWTVEDMSSDEDDDDDNDDNGEEDTDEITDEDDDEDRDEDDREEDEDGRTKGKVESTGASELSGHSTACFHLLMY